MFPQYLARLIRWAAYAQTLIHVQKCIASCGFECGHTYIKTRSHDYRKSGVADY